MKTKKKRKKKRTGISPILLLVASFALTAPAANKKAAEAFALVVGSVFQESGYTLPGAEVTLVPDPQPDSPAAKGAKKMHTFSDARGEFVFRVPPFSLRYTIKVAAKGFESQEKSVEVQADQRVDVTFQLQAQSK